MPKEEYQQYVGAPYNFIGINEKVYEKTEMPPHDVIDKNRKSGKVTYEIEAMMPIFVDNGNGEFYKNCYGEAAIPGSTVRGMVRSNIQILSFSSVKDDIENGYFMYRNVANGKERKAYNEILGNKIQNKMSVLTNVKAGYIRKRSDHYEIVRTKADKKMKGLNYYVLNERLIIEDRCRGFEWIKDKFQNQEAPFRKEIRKGKPHYIGKKNPKYHPYYMEISYKKKGDKDILAIGEPGKYDNRGYVISSGFMNEKKAFYVIPEMDENETIQIPEKDINSFRRDYESRKNQVEVFDKTFFRLPETGEVKPVFYIEEGGRLYFGFTPRLRLFYQQDIYAGLKGQQKTAELDYCKSLFGFTGEKKSYRSRLFFGDAEMEHSDCGQREYKIVLGNPKPTSYLDYLDAEKGNAAVTYNDAFKLRGIKQYWLKEEITDGEEAENENIKSSMLPYMEGARFKGEVKFENLSEEELGMLLWGIALEEESQQNMGKGKPYGYGRVKIRITGLEIIKSQELYGTEQFCLQPYGEETAYIKQYIKKAKQDMSDFLGHDIMTDPRIKDFFAMKEVIPSERTRYMKLEEYQKRVTDNVKLPAVQDVKQGKKIFCEKSNEHKNSGRYDNRKKQNTTWKDKDDTGGFNTFGAALKGIKL